MSVESAQHIHWEERTLHPHTDIGHYVCGYHWIWKERDSAFENRNGTSRTESDDDDDENKNNSQGPGRIFPSPPTHVTARMFSILITFVNTCLY
jgi:hypothetical protein